MALECYRHTTAGRLIRAQQAGVEYSACVLPALAQSLPVIRRWRDPNLLDEDTK